MSRARDNADIISNGQQCTAWCVFDGDATGTNAPLDGYNVASITRVSEGLYDVTFTTPMDNTNFTVSCFTKQQAAINGYQSFEHTDVRVTTKVKIQTWVTSAAGDAYYVQVIIFGGKD